jgi:pimeloyl-ACP methyl ester carboxylesterase
VDWDAEARAVRDGARAARLNAAAAIARSRADQARWAEQDCQHAVTDLARFRADDIAAGLRSGPTWTHAGQLTAGETAVILLLTPDAPGVNRLEDATALRGQDRYQFAIGLNAHLAVLNTGHCLHRDDPDTWLDAVTSFAARGPHA